MVIMISTIRYSKRLFKVRLLDSCCFICFVNLFFVAKKRESLKAKAGLNREQLLQLALAWDAIEVAKQHIIKDDLSDLSVSKRKLFRRYR